MITGDTVRRELLRLAGTKRYPICINTRRISVIFNVPEKSVRRELTKLAEQKLIRISGWDGRQVRPLDAWPNADEFVESTSGDGQVHVGPWEPQ
jgi:hypothetical protein